MEREKLTLRLPGAIIQKISVRARKIGISKNAMISIILSEAVQKGGVNQNENGEE